MHRVCDTIHLTTLVTSSLAPLVSGGIWHMAYALCFTTSDSRCSRDCHVPEPKSLTADAYLSSRDFHTRTRFCCTLLQTLKSTNAMAKAMQGVTKAMGRMNKQVNMPQLQKIMMEFEKQVRHKGPAAKPACTCVCFCLRRTCVLLGFSVCLCCLASQCACTTCLLSVLELIWIEYTISCLPRGLCSTLCTKQQQPNILNRQHYANVFANIVFPPPHLSFLILPPLMPALVGDDGYEAGDDG